MSVTYPDFSNLMPNLDYMDEHPSISNLLKSLSYNFDNLFALGLNEIVERLEISKEVKELLSNNKLTAETLRELKNLAIYSAIVLLGMEVPIKRIEISGFASGESLDEEDLELYVEIKVPTKDSNVVFGLWDYLLKVIEAELGQEILKKYSVFVVGD